MGAPSAGSVGGTFRPDVGSRGSLSNDWRSASKSAAETRTNASTWCFATSGAPETCSVPRTTSGTDDKVAPHTTWTQCAARTVESLGASGEQAAKANAMSEMVATAAILFMRV